MDGIRWGVSFLNTDVTLYPEQRVYLVAQAILMYIKEKGKRIVNACGMYGNIKTDGETYTIGSSCKGQYFKALVELPNGKRANLEFLIAEGPKINPEMN